MIGIYGPNDDTLRVGLCEELENLFCLWDIPWCLVGDFNVVRLKSERSTRGRLTFTMCEFSSFINQCNLVDPPLESAWFTWSIHEEVPTLSRIDRFLFSVEWEDHFQGAHQVTLPNITSNHVQILLHVGDVSFVKRPFRSENVWLEAEEFSHFVKTWWDQFHISSSPSYVLAKKLNILKFKLND